MHPSATLLVSVGCSVVSVGAWTYNDVTAWATENPNCAAGVPNQSPIDVVTTNLGTTANPLQFQGFPDSSVTPEIRSEMIINDHTWELEWDVDQAATDKYGVLYNNHLYQLNQFHFHSPSEHTVDGQHYDMEAHLVHSCFGNECTTIDAHDENLVVAIFMNLGEENTYLSSFWGDLAALASDSAATPFVENLVSPYNAFLPESKDFYRYVGSTTTPSCVQNVSWFLMSSPVTLSLEQLTAYRTAISNHDNTQTAVVSEAPAGVAAGWNTALGTNNRPAQVMGNRLVEAYTAPRPLTINSNRVQIGLLVAAITLVVAVLIVLCFKSYTASKNTPKKRGVVKPKKATKAAPPAEEVPLVPLVAPHLQAPMPQLFTQPMQVPLTYATPMQIQQPQMQQQQFQPQYMMYP